MIHVPSDAKFPGRYMLVIRDGSVKQIVPFEKLADPQRGSKVLLDALQETWATYELAIVLAKTLAELDQKVQSIEDAARGW